MDPLRPNALLGDTPERDYSLKLRLFNEYASAELRRAVQGLNLAPGMTILDAGCGTGETLRCLAESVAPTGRVWGIDLSRAHLNAARSGIGPRTGLAQADIARPPFSRGAFDLVWSVNTVNHLANPVDGVRVLQTLLRPLGRLAVGQSSVLPDMYFAWDSRLERVTNEAVRQYYRDKYNLTEQSLTSVRSLVGTLRAAGLRNVRAETSVIERVSPTSAADDAYLVQAIFQGTFGQKLRPYLSADDFAELGALCDPNNAAFALRRSDFHFMQTFTLVIGDAAAR